MAKCPAKKPMAQSLATTTDPGPGFAKYRRSLIGGLISPPKEDAQETTNPRAFATGVILIGAETPSVKV